MTKQPRLLDAFCGAGGCTRGYQLAGVEVTGVDNRPQPRYVGEHFVEGDALEYIAEHGHEFDAIHASPPCQAFTNARVIHGREHPDLLTPARVLLKATGVPWIIENVPGAPMRPDVVLCGSMFGEPRLVRHRWFETSWHMAPFTPATCAHGRGVVSVFGHGGHIYHGVETWREVMGIDWMTSDELSQAIPPAYTAWIGAHLLAALKYAA